MDKVHFGSGAICAFGTKAKGYKSFVLNKHITAKNLPYA